jgi:hypothetical protein
MGEFRYTGCPERTLTLCFCLWSSVGVRKRGFLKGMSTRHDISAIVRAADMAGSDAALMSVSARRIGGLLLLISP